MTDIAQLGIAIDSRSTVQATTALNQLAAAAKPAAAAADDLSTKHAGLSTQAMAAGHSVRSLVEALASGQPITQALGQQLNHLSYAASGSSGLSGAFKEVAKSLLGLASPTTLVVGGLAALAAGGVFAAHSIAETEKALDDTAHAAGITIGQLHDLAAAAAFKGIDSNDFLKAMDRFSADVYDAQHNMGSLAEVMRANGQSAQTFKQYLEKAADIIKNATSDQQRLQLLQQMGLPPTMDWVRFLSQGSEGIKQAAAEAVKFGDAADQAMVAKAREFDEAWNKSISNFSNGFKSGFVSFIGYLDTINSKANSALMKLGVNVGTNLLTDAMRGGPTQGTTLSQAAANGFYDKVGGPFNPSAGTSKDKNVTVADIARQQPLLGLLGQTQPAKQEPKKEKQDDRDRLRLPAAA